MSRLDHLMLVLVTSLSGEKQESSYCQSILVVENLPLQAVQVLLHLYPTLVLVSSQYSLEQQNLQQYLVNPRVYLLFKVAQTRHLYLQLMLVLVNSLHLLVLELSVLLLLNQNQYCSSSTVVRSRSMSRTMLVLVLYSVTLEKQMSMQPLMTKELYTLTTRHPELQLIVMTMVMYVKMQQILIIAMSSSIISMSRLAPMRMK